MKNFNRLSHDLNSIQKAFKSNGMKTLSRIVKVEALNHFQDSWAKQGFTDGSLVKWQPRKAPAKYSRRWSERNAGRAILVGHQSLTRGVHLKDSLVGRISGSRVVISTNKVYAQVHNEGGKAGRGAGFTMPMRRFMGPSKELNQRCRQKFDREINKLFRTN